jgi:hypothetical protein
MRPEQKILDYLASRKQEYVPLKDIVNTTEISVFEILPLISLFKRKNYIVLKNDSKLTHLQNLINNKGKKESKIEKIIDETSLQITTDGEDYNLATFHSLKTRRPLVFKFFVVAGVIITALIFIYKNFGQEIIGVFHTSEKDNLVQNYKAEINYIPIFSSNSQDSLNILISRFSKNRDLSIRILNRYKEILSPEDLKFINIKTVDSLSSSLIVDSLLSYAKTNNCHILLYGDFEKNKVNNDTAMIYYNYVISSEIMDIKNYSTNSRGICANTLNDYVSDSSLKNYDYILFNSIGQLYLTKFYIHNEEAQKADYPKNPRIIDSTMYLSKAINFFLKAKAINNSSFLNYTIYNLFLLNWPVWDSSYTKSTRIYNTFENKDSSNYFYMYCGLMEIFKKNRYTQFTENANKLLFLLFAKKFIGIDDLRFCIYINEALAYSRMKNYKLARQLYTTALEIPKLAIHQKIYINGQISKMSYLMGNYPEAFSNLEQVQKDLGSFAYTDLLYLDMSIELVLKYLNENPGKHSLPKDIFEYHNRGEDLGTKYSATHNTMFLYYDTVYCRSCQ